MEEIKVGEYVRTKKDGICKLLQIDEDNMWCGYVDKPFWLRKDNIVKHSPNIIDLIEIEDVVKVKDHDWIRVFNIDDEDTLESFIEDCEENNWILMSIVTKEQFESVQYTIEKGDE